MEAGLRAAGHEVHTVEVYDARAAQALTNEALSAIAARRVIAALHYSHRSAEIFLQLAQSAGVADALHDMTHVALSEHVAAPLRKLGLQTLVAAKPDEEHLLSLLPTQLRTNTP